VTRHPAFLFACSVAALAIGGRGPDTAVLLKAAPPPCEAARRGPAAVSWFGPDEARQRVRLSAWCESVGPPVVIEPRDPDELVDVGERGLVVVTWNVHEGGGDLQRFLDWLRDRTAPRSGDAPAVVVLLQEAFRGGDDVPADAPAGVQSPGWIHPTRTATSDIAVFAQQTGMWLAYVPSMRNGARVREDRGCAILSTLPLSDVAAIELPWVSQRRVAVMATISARRDAAPWRLRAISVHLDNRRGRSRQAAALAVLAGSYRSDDASIVIGGDLNTWFGPREDAVRRLDEVIPRVRECGSGPTAPLRFHLDYLFTLLEPESRRGCEIAAGAFGSDHHPTVLRVFGEREGR
jgi:endonuclease/exonuclease/phosphatase family metal-dependent hydrolase